MTSNVAPVAQHYMDTPHYRVNKFVSVVELVNGKIGRAASCMGIELRTEDLAHLIRESAPLYTGGTGVLHFPKVNGVWRLNTPDTPDNVKAQEERVLEVYFSRRPTDDEVRAFHDFVAPRGAGVTAVVQGPPRHPSMRAWLDGNDDTGGCIARLEHEVTTLKKERAALQRDLAIQQGRVESLINSRRASERKADDAPKRQIPYDFLNAVRRLVICGRTTGGTAGRDDGLCVALDAVEALLPPVVEPKGRMPPLCAHPACKASGRIGDPPMCETHDDLRDSEPGGHRP